MLGALCTLGERTVHAEEVVVTSSGDLPEGTVVTPDPIVFDVVKQRPHWGSDTHGDPSCGSTPRPWSSRKYPDNKVYKWGGCHATVYYQIESGMKAKGAAWIKAVDAAFEQWDRGLLCSPHWTNFDLAPKGAIPRVTVNFRGGTCAGVDWWWGCAGYDRLVSTTDQIWHMDLNSSIPSPVLPFALGVSGHPDAQSVLTTEIAHVHSFAHFPDFSETVSTSASCSWGRTACSMKQADSCTFSPYTVSCKNCGNRRTLGVGDLALLGHLYGVHTNGCATTGATRLAKCPTGCMTQTCGPLHTWQNGLCLECPDASSDASADAVDPDADPDAQIADDSGEIYDTSPPDDTDPDNTPPSVDLPDAGGSGAAPTETGDSGGCGCRTGSGQGPSFALGTTVLLMLMARRRRRGS